MTVIRNIKAVMAVTPAMRATALALVLIMSGCSMSASSPEPSVSIEPTAQPSPDPTDSATAVPTSSVQPTDTLTPSPTQAEPTFHETASPPSITPSPVPPIDGDDVWRSVLGLPPGLTITGLGGFDLMVTGYLPANSTECPDATVPFASSYYGNGEWFDAIFRNYWYGSADMLAMPYGFNAIGRAIPREDGCGPLPFTSWAPTDKADWYEAGLEGLGPDAIIELATITESRVTVIAGDYGGGSDRIGIWVSDDEAFAFDLVVRRAAEPPTRDFNQTFSALGVVGETVVGFEGTLRPAWYSLDSGNHWNASEYQPTFRFHASGITESDGQLLAAGLVCCTDVGVRVGAVIRSDDGGLTWSEPALLPTVPEVIVANDGHLMSFGERTYVSNDGIEWHEAAALPGYRGGDVQVLGPDLYADAEDTTVYVAAPDGRLWSAALGALRVESWPPVQPVEVPGVGYSARGSINAHCGVNGPLYFALRTWAPDVPDGEYPESFGDGAERGTFSLVGQNRLEFAGDHGDTVVFHPTDNPPPSFPCA